MKKTEYVIIAVLLLIIAALTAGVVVSVQNNQTAKYELLYAQEHAKVALREKQIDGLQSEKKVVFKEIKRLQNETKKSVEIANYFSAQAKNYKTKYQTLRDSSLAKTIATYPNDTSNGSINPECNPELAFAAADSAILYFEKENEELRKSVSKCDSTIEKMEDAQGITEQQFLMAKLNNDSKDNQINLQLRQIKVEKRKAIAIGTVGGFMIAGGVAGLITLAVLK